MTSKLTNKIYFLSIAFFVISLCSKVFLCTTLAVKGVTLKDYAERKLVLQKEVAGLSFLKSSLSNIKIVEERANELGFLPMEETLQVIDTSSAIKVASLTIR